MSSINHCIHYLLYGFVLSTSVFGVASAQENIPIGTWRAHISFQSIHSVAVTDQNIYGAAENGVMVFSLKDNSLTGYSKLDGLSSTGITYISADPITKKVLIAYEDGNLDILLGNIITNFDRLKNSETISGSKRINHITFQNSYAYLSTDYGVVVFDINKQEVKEAWRDLGDSGGTIKIFQSTFLNDSIFLATEAGVLAGKLNDNLLDFNKWTRFDTGVFGGSIQSVAANQSKVYAAINSSGIYHFTGADWVQESFLQGIPFHSLNASANDILIATTTELWELSNSNTLTQIVSTSISSPYMALEGGTGKLWVGDEEHGLVSNTTGSFASYLPNGPVNTETSRLKYHAKTMLGVGDGHSSTYVPLNKNSAYDLLYAGIWSIQSSSMKDLTDIDFSSNDEFTFTSSFGYGVESRNSQGAIVRYDESNSPLINLNPPGRFVNITAIEFSPEGLWVANYGASTPLHLLKSDNTWVSFSFASIASRYPTELAIDVYDQVWMLANPNQGGGIVVFNKEENTSAYLTDVAGSGGLPSKNVHSIAMDRDGYVWVGTDIGVAYFVDLSRLFTSGVNAIKPIFENRFLLKDDKVTAIAVDGGNRKWMGTERGVWLFNPSGETLIHNFTAENSPLLSNVIRSIEIDDKTGEVFISTDKGVISYRSDATVSTNAFESVKIFPNPVTAEFTGTVGISGLANDAIVKITDISGKLIWQTKANGGTATWNVRDYNGNHAATGMYIVFSATEDGAESAVGKIAVIE
ncbi:MAG TPA: two-component regulator propeller domain-containing protein [Chryseolinea sp.]|nr:two-component regulator propeller domain-containing protein [Chryseolinea sp.]